MSRFRYYRCYGCTIHCLIGADDVIEQGTYCIFGVKPCDSRSVCQMNLNEIGFKTFYSALDESWDRKLNYICRSKGHICDHPESCYFRVEGRPKVCPFTDKCDCTIYTEMITGKNWVQHVLGKNACTGSNTGGI